MAQFRILRNKLSTSQKMLSSLLFGVKYFVTFADIFCDRMPALFIVKGKCLDKGGCREIFDFKIFFVNLFSPASLILPKKQFRIFRKFAKIFVPHSYQ
jgi:hypothetical protein